MSTRLMFKINSNLCKNLIPTKINLIKKQVDNISINIFNLFLINNI